MNAEVGVGDELRFFQLAVEGGGDHSAGVLQIHALAAVAAPAGVDQIDVGAGLGHLLSQHPGIDGGVQRHERGAKAGGEGGHGGGDAPLGARQLAGEAGDKVVHGLLLVQLGDGGHDAVGVGGEEDHRFGGAADAGDGGIGDIVHGVAHAGVLSQAAVGVVGDAGLLVHDDVLHQGAELDGPEDLGLPLLGQVNALGVAAALEIKDRVIRPAVLVIANELAVGIGGQGGLAGAGQAEEDGGVPGLTDVGGAVHGEDALLGHEVVHDGEDRLLDLTGVLAACDEHHLLLIVDHDGGLRVHMVPLRDALKAGGADDGEVRLVIGKRLFRGTQQKLVDEKVLAGQLVDHPESFGVFGVRTGKAVKDKDLPVLEIGHHFFIQRVKHRLRGRHVDLAPRDIVMHALAVHDEFIVGRAAGILSRPHAQGAGIAELTLAPAQRVLHQLGRLQITVNSLGIQNAKLLQTIGLHIRSSFIDAQNLYSTYSSRTALGS